uniref:Alpha-1,3-glucosyltransferase n=1 Tax=Ixodes ricinus TaxID=34613 RepID=V5H2S3_IXORI
MLAFYLILHKHPGLVLWFSTIPTFSMLPLLCKDGLVTPYVALVVLNIVFVLKAYLETSQQSRLITVLFALSMGGCTFLNAAHLLLPPPRRYPDVHSLLNAVYSCGHFVAFVLYTHYLQYQLPTTKYTKIKRSEGAVRRAAAFGNFYQPVPWFRDNELYTEWQCWSECSIASFFFL